MVGRPTTKRIGVNISLKADDTIDIFNASQPTINIPYIKYISLNETHYKVFKSKDVNDYAVFHINSVACFFI